MLFGFLFAILVSINALQPIELNVGGEIIATYAETLQKSFCAEDWIIASYVEAYFDEAGQIPLDKDSAGRLFIDHDPMYFKQILNYCRYGKLIIPSHLNEQIMHDTVKALSLTIVPQNTHVEPEKSVVEKIRDELVADRKIPKVIAQNLSTDKRHMAIKLSPTVFDTEQILNNVFRLKRLILVETYGNYSRVVAIGKEDSVMTAEDIVIHFDTFFPMYAHTTVQGDFRNNAEVFEYTENRSISRSLL